MHIDALFGEPGKNVIGFDLIGSQFRHLMKVAVSVREGADLLIHAAQAASALITATTTASCGRLRLAECPRRN
ncbi:hypothetical protein ADL25_42840 [Streptomyces sp. NRRL F-5122]|nr:hypothetical protein ADL25_42840 [Streptomyces sp. NRRL F-5122]